MIRNHTRDLCENSGEWAKEILTQEFKRGSEVKEVWIAPLCGNSAEWAGIMVDSMSDSPKLLDFHRLSMNSALWATKKLLEHSDKIDFHAMSANRFPLEPNLNESEAELGPTSIETSAGIAYHKVVTYNAIEQKLFVGYFGAPTKPSNEIFELLDAAICANPKLAEGLLGDKPLGRLHTLREEHNRLVHAVTVSAEDGIMALNAEAGDNDEEAVNLAERYHQLEDEAAKLRSTISDWEGAQDRKEERGRSRQQGPFAANARFNGRGSGGGARAAGIP